MEKEIYHHGSATFTFSSKNTVQFSQWELSTSTECWSTLSFRASINVLKCFSEQKWIRMQIKLSELETQSKLVVTLHRSNNLISFLLLPECFLLSCVTAGTAGQNCSLAVHPLCQPLRQQGEKKKSLFSESKNSIIYTIVHHLSILELLIYFFTSQSILLPI